MKLPKGLQYDVVKGVEAMKQHELLSSEKGKQLFEMHEITVPGLAFEAGGKNLEQRWEARDRDNGAGRFVALIHDDKKVISMTSGIEYEDGNAIFLNTATRPQYRKQGFLEKAIAGYVEGKEEGTSVKALLSTKVKKDDVSDEQLASINEAVVGLYDEGKSNKQILPEIQKILRDTVGEEKVPADITKKDNFNMLTQFMGRDGTEDTRYTLAKGGSEINLVAKVPVTEKLKQTAQDILNGKEAAISR